MRKTEFANDEFYHIYNRGVDKRDVFINRVGYERFFLSVSLLNDEKEGWLEVWRNLPGKKKSINDFRRFNLRKPLVDIVAYCFNPNHYHFILKQLEEKGVEKFMHRLGTAYTMFFNMKYKRSGALFQGRFKSIHIDSNEYLLYLSAYVNKNNFIHGYGNSNWRYSSLAEYRKEKNQKVNICNPSSILDQFESVNDYGEFLNKNALYLKDKKEEQKYLLESPEG
ncbi:MAG: transposase [Candidatus Moranbacteria bacterium]|nr:transposase [Candidatus Moranbacteria bacterium]